jgi:hypothetical protein
MARLVQNFDDKADRHPGQHGDLLGGAAPLQQRLDEADLVPEAFGSDARFEATGIGQFLPANAAIVGPVSIQAMSMLQLLVTKNLTPGKARRRAVFTERATSAGEVIVVLSVGKRRRRLLPADGACRKQSWIRLRAGSRAR